MCFAVAAVLKTMHVMETAQAVIPSHLHAWEMIKRIEQYPPRYHITPKQWHWLVYQKNGQNFLEQARWFIQLGPIENINFTSEKLFSDPRYRKDLEEHRALIPVSGFFEEYKKVTPTQFYYFHHPQHDWFWIPAIYREQEGELRFTILTKPPNSVVRPIHRRMPVLLAKEQSHHWLQLTNKEYLEPEYPFPLQTYPVDDIVKDETVDDPRCIARVAPRNQSPKSSQQMNMFEE